MTKLIKVERRAGSIVASGPSKMTTELLFSTAVITALSAYVKIASEDLSVSVVSKEMVLEGLTAMPFPLGRIENEWPSYVAAVP